MPPLTGSASVRGTSQAVLPDLQCVRAGIFWDLDNIGLSTRPDIALVGLQRVQSAVQQFGLSVEEFNLYANSVTLQR